MIPCCLVNSIHVPTSVDAGSVGSLVAGCGHLRTPRESFRETPSTPSIATGMSKARRMQSITNSAEVRSTRPRRSDARLGRLWDELLEVARLVALENFEPVLVHVLDQLRVGDGDPHRSNPSANLSAAVVGESSRSFRPPGSPAPRYSWSPSTSSNVWRYWRPRSRVYPQGTESAFTSR